MHATTSRVKKRAAILGPLPLHVDGFSMPKGAEIVTKQQ
jgi:hypothetical protein